MTEEAASREVLALFRAWYTSLVRYAWRQTGSADLAEDIAQESFLSLYRGYTRGVEVRNPKGWTLKVVRDEISKFRRHGLRRGEQLEPGEALDERPARGSPVQDRINEADELNHYLSLLTAREEQVMILRLQALRYKEIASELGLSVNSVKTLLARALRKMQHAAGGRSTATGLSIDEQENTPKTLQ